MISDFSGLFFFSMEMPGRRSNYTLLNQIPDDNFHQLPPHLLPKIAGAGAGATHHESLSGEKSKGKGDRGSDWELVENRMTQAQSRIGASGYPVSSGLQRQSSGSSFGESSISGEYCIPSLSNPDASYGQLNEGVGGLKAVEVSSGGGGGSSSSKSWAQQTEESYQMQLALALRLSSEATCAEDPNFLDPVPDEAASRSSALTVSAEAMSHRFWVSL